MVRVEGRIGWCWEEGARSAHLQLRDRLAVHKRRLEHRVSPLVRRQRDDAAHLDAHLGGGLLDVAHAVGDEFRVVRAQVDLREPHPLLQPAHRARACSDQQQQRT